MYLTIESNSSGRAEIITRKEKQQVQNKLLNYRKNTLKGLYKKVNIIS